MLTHFAPLIIYYLSYPVMLLTLFRVDIGIIFFIALVPIIALMKKIAEFPNGNNFADMLLVAIIIGWIFKSLKEDRRLIVKSPINVVVMLIVFGSILNLIRGYTFLSLPSDINIVRLMTWKNYMILPLLYFISANNIETEKKVKLILFFIALTMIAMDFNFYSTFRLVRREHYSHDIRIAGPFSFLGPNEMGVFFAMYTFMLLGISYFIEQKKLKNLILIACLINFYPIIYSYSRGTYICTMVGFLTLGILKDRKYLVLLIIILSSYSYILPNSVVERIDMTFLDKDHVSEARLQASGFDVGDSTTIEITGRKELWDKAMNYFKAEPIIGIGFDTFRHLEGWITHSLYMKILAEQGIVGMLIYIIFIITLLRQSFKLYKYADNKLAQGIGLGFFVSVIVHLAGSISGDQSLYYNLMAIFWFFMGVVARFNIEYTNRQAVVLD